jgi:hypothetical protein
MQVSKLEQLSERLQRLRQQLAAAAGDTPLDERHELVRAARECEFMLPERLTVPALAGAVAHQIDVVAVLIERARRHEELPASAQLAAEQEYTATDEDYAASVHRHEAQRQPPARR